MCQALIRGIRVDTNALAAAAVVQTGDTGEQQNGGAGSVAGLPGRPPTLSAFALSGRVSIGRGVIEN
jgi:hypothetical protein